MENEQTTNITATAEEPSITDLFTEMTRRIADLEGQLQSLIASAATKEETGRKTARSFSNTTKLTENVNASAVDDSLKSLSIEQRIAVKMEMHRHGLIG